MKDRMIIIREGVMFIITVTHEPQKKQEEKNAPALDTEITDEPEQRLPDISISAN
jgi:hypothetical protein